MLRRRGHCFCFSKGLCRGSVCTFALNHFKVSNRDNINLKCYLAACHLCDTWGGPHTCCRRVVGLYQRVDQLAASFTTCRPVVCTKRYDDKPSVRYINAATLAAFNKAGRNAMLWICGQLHAGICARPCKSRTFFFFFFGG